MHGGRDAIDDRRAITMRCIDHMCVAVRMHACAAMRARGDGAQHVVMSHAIDASNEMNGARIPLMRVVFGDRPMAVQLCVCVCFFAL